MLGTPALHDITASATPQAEVRTDFTDFLNGSQGKLSGWRASTCSLPDRLTTRSRQARPGRPTVTGCGPECLLAPAAISF
jgi:hypothetical protein